MARFASNLRVPMAAGIAAMALLAGCGNDDDGVASEAGVSLAPPAEDASPLTDDDAIPPGVATVVDDAADLDVEDQRGDGSAVVVYEVRAGESDGFVVVYDAGRTVLGSLGVAAGIREMVSVPLATPIRASQELTAALFRDTDRNRQFDPAIDALVLEREEPDDLDDEQEAQDSAEAIAEDFDYVLN